MANIDLTKAKQVLGVYGSQRTNELIELGWSLIETATGKDEAGYPLTQYSLAWFGEDTPKQL